MRVSPNGTVLWEHTYNTPIDLAQNMYNYYAPTDVEEFSDGSILVLVGIAGQEEIFLLRVDANGCIDQFGCEEDLLLDTDEIFNNLDRNISIYPNPANDELHIDMHELNDLTYTIINSQGQALQVGTIHRGNTVLNVSSLSGGMYLIKFEDEGQYPKVQRFMKQ